MSWLGTWSFARPPYGYFVPMVALTLIGLASYLTVLRRHRPVDLPWLPIWIASPVLIALAYYVLLRLALTGAGRISVGHYVHVMVAPFAFAMGIGIGSWWGHPGVRRTVIALTLYALVFSVAVSWVQVLLFSGQLTKSPGQFYRAVSPPAPMVGIPEAMSRLAVLAYPCVGVICWVGGAMLLVAGLKLIWQSLQDIETGA